VQSADDNSPVTVEDLVNAVHESLSKHISGTEWWIVTDSVREKVTAQYVQNCEATERDGRRKAEVEKPRQKNEGLRRVDWLLDGFVMKGLEKDDKFAKLRFRDKDVVEQTWVLVNGPP